MRLLFYILLLASLNVLISCNNENKSQQIRTRNHKIQSHLLDSLDKFLETNSINDNSFIYLIFDTTNNKINSLVGISSVPPIILDTVNKELKGILKHKEKDILIYDYKNSTGYNLYFSTELNKEPLSYDLIIDDRLPKETWSFNK